MNLLIFLYIFLNFLCRTFSQVPTSLPTSLPSFNPSYIATLVPSSSPSSSPSFSPSTSSPSISNLVPSSSPSNSPSFDPTSSPSISPTYFSPVYYPTSLPTNFVPSSSPTHSPTFTPSEYPSYSPTLSPSRAPTIDPLTYPELPTVQYLSLRSFYNNLNGKHWAWGTNDRNPFNDVDDFFEDDFTIDDDSEFPLLNDDDNNSYFGNSTFKDIIFEILLDSFIEFAEYLEVDMTDFYNTVEPIDGIQWNFNQTNPTYNLDFLDRRDFVSSIDVYDNRESDPCRDSWEGIACEIRQYFNETTQTIVNYSVVTKLVLSFHNITGKIGNSLQNLSSLDTIKLSSNKISGAIPEYLFEFENITIINFQNNTLWGSLSNTTRYNPGITEILIGRNFITGTIPTSLYNLTSLIQLRMEGNLLRGELFSDINNLSNLELLYLSGNHLTGHFPLINNLTNLKLLSVSFNKFKGPINGNFVDFNNLRYFDLGFNKFMGEFPSYLFKLPNVSQCLIEYNSFTGTIPNDIFSNKYTSLYLENNLFTGTIPVNLFINNNYILNYLALGNNAFTGHFISDPTKYIFLPNVSVVNIGDNYFSGTLEQFNLGVLVFHYDISDNLFTGSLPDPSYIPGQTVKNNQNWKLLNFFFASNNFFTGPIPRNFNSSLALIFFDVTNNLLNGDLNIFSNCPRSINYFYFGSNYFTGTIPDNIVSCDSLTDLTISDNLLTGNLKIVKEQSQEIHKYDASYNYLTGTVPYDIFLLEKLQILLLQHNYLTGTINIDEDLTSNFVYPLINIDLSTNFLTGYLPDFKKYRSLTTLAAGSNCFSRKISENICHLTDLTLLSLDGLQSSSECRIPLFPALPFFNSFTLKNIYHKATFPSCLYNMKSLQSLHLAGNSFQGNLKNKNEISTLINDLTLSYNLLTGDIPAPLLDRLYNVIDLSNNKFNGHISTPSEKRLYGELILDNNRLSGKIPSSYNLKEQISILNGNMFSCKSNSELPKYDSYRDVYNCGSNSMNSTLLLWLFIFISLLLLVSIILYLMSRYKKYLKKIQWKKLALESHSQINSKKYDEEINEDNQYSLSDDNNNENQIRVSLTISPDVNISSILCESDSLDDVGNYLLSSTSESSSTNTTNNQSIHEKSPKNFFNFIIKILIFLKKILNFIILFYFELVEYIWLARIKINFWRNYLLLDIMNQDDHNSIRVKDSKLSSPSSSFSLSRIISVSIITKNLSSSEFEIKSPITLFSRYTRSFCYMVIIISIFLFVFFTPIYFILSKYTNGSYKDKYIWQFSSLYLSGLTPSVVLIICFIMVIIGTFIMNEYFRNKKGIKNLYYSDHYKITDDININENDIKEDSVSKLSPIAIAAASAINKSNPDDFSLSTSQSQSIQQSDDKKKSFFRHFSLFHSTSSSSSNNSLSSFSFFFRSSGNSSKNNRRYYNNMSDYKGWSSRKAFMVIFIILIDILCLSLVDILYIIQITDTNSVKLFMYQVLLAFYRVLWNDFILWKIIPHVKWIFAILYGDIPCNFNFLKKKSIDESNISETGNKLDEDDTLIDEDIIDLDNESYIRQSRASFYPMFTNEMLKKTLSSSNSNSDSNSTYASTPKIIPNNNLIESNSSPNLSIASEIKTQTSPKPLKFHLWSTFDIQLLAFIMLINNIIVPCIATALVSTKCFYRAFFSAEPVYSSYSYEICSNFIVAFRIGYTCLDYESKIEVIKFTPPFVYSYQCSSTLVTNYASVYIYMFIISGFIMPFLKITMKIICSCLNPNGFFYSIFVRFLHVKLLSTKILYNGYPKIPKFWNKNENVKEEEKVDVNNYLHSNSLSTSNTNCISNESYNDDIEMAEEDINNQQIQDKLPRISQTIFQKSRFVVKINSLFAILLLYGVIFPPIAIAACISVLSFTILEETLLGKLLYDADKYELKIKQIREYEQKQKKYQNDIKKYQKLKLLYDKAKANKSSTSSLPPLVYPQAPQPLPLNKTILPSPTLIRFRIEQECDHIYPLFRMIFPISSPFASCMFGYIIFDTIGDVYGWKTALPFALSICVLPIILNFSARFIESFYENNNNKDTKKSLFTIYKDYFNNSSRINNSNVSEVHEQPEIELKSFNQ